MAINRNGAGTKYKFLHNGVMLKKGFHNSTTLIWSAGSTVTYNVDTGVSYTEEVDYGASCLAPKTFTPAKDGWTFVGWRNTTTADKYVLTEKVMEGDPITLYAVFKQTVTTNWISGEAGATKNTVTGTNYYNNGTIGYATLAIPTHASYSGWTWRGWSYNDNTSANASVDPNKDAATLTSVDGTRTYYGLYQKTVTQTFISYNKTEKVTGTAYYNASGNVQNAAITYPSGAAYSGWTWRGWSAHNMTAADASVEFAAGYVLNTVTDYTVYGLYWREITANFYSGLNMANHQKDKGTSYYNAAGNTKFAPVTFPAVTAVSGWSVRGWSQWWTGAADAAVTYREGSALDVNPDNDGITFYGLYEQTITLTTVANGTTNAQYGTVYHNSAGNTKYPAFTVANPTKVDATFLGWDYSGDSTADVTAINNTTFYTSVTCKAVFQYADITFTLDSGYNSSSQKSMYIDTSIYSSVTVTNSNPGNTMVGADVFRPDGNYLIHLCGVSSETQNFPSSGTYRFRAFSNYAYASTVGTFTIKSRGGTVVG